MPELHILFEDNNIIVVHKQAGLATQTKRLGEKDLVSEVMNHLSSTGKKPYVAVINRLDQPVEGIVLIAKNENSAKTYSNYLQNGKIDKYYQATVYGKVELDNKLLEDYMKKDGKSNLSSICNPKDKDAKKAKLEVTGILQEENTAILSIHLLTGRHHQIRLQLSHRGYPILGDQKYGTRESIEYSRTKAIRNVQLVAKKLIIPDIQGKKEMTFEI